MALFAMSRDTVHLYSYNESQPDALFLTLFSKELYMFRRDLLSIIRSLNTVSTTTGICHTVCLWGQVLTSLADSQHNKHDKYLLPCIQFWDSWWWTVDLSETCRVLYQNKSEKQCILLAFIIRITKNQLIKVRETELRKKNMTLNFSIIMAALLHTEPVSTGNLDHLSSPRTWWKIFLYTHDKLHSLFENFLSVLRFK